MRKTFTLTPEEAGEWFKKGDLNKMFVKVFAVVRLFDLDPIKVKRKLESGEITAFYGDSTNLEDALITTKDAINLAATCSRGDNDN